MKRLTYTSFLLAAGFLLVTACTDDFEEINRNPNASEAINPEFLMSEVIISTAYEYQNEAYFDKPASAARYITLVRNEGNDLFGWGPTGWDNIFRRLSNNKNFYDQAEARKQDQYLAIATILRAFNFAYLTDLWGDVPYNEALLSKDKGVVHPKYDTQETIYPDLLAQLKEANDRLAATALEIDKKADVMYGGDATQWRKFANSLRLRLLLRASSKYPRAAAEMQEILSNPSQYPIFTENDDNAEVAYIGDIGANSWPGGAKANAFNEFDKRKPSKELVDKLLARNDPRLEAWIAPVDTKDGALVDQNEYVGVPNAIQAPYDYNGGNDNISRLSEMFNQDNHPMVKASLMTYTEVLFILAEAVQKGLAAVPGETAESLYTKGIESSMDYYDLADAAEEGDYYNQPLVKYNGTLEQLIEQKWLALFLKGAEGWFDHRRTGFPKFTLGPAAAQRTIPLRYIYPESERSYNDAQYRVAVASMGADERNTPMWYLK
jgi:hypothetical protein